MEGQKEEVLTRRGAVKARTFFITYRHLQKIHCSLFAQFKNNYKYKSVEKADCGKHSLLLNKPVLHGDVTC